MALPCKFPGQIEERLLEIVVALRWNLIILQILLPVEGNLLCLHLPVLDINLVTTKNNWDVFTDPEKSVEQKMSIIWCKNLGAKLSDERTWFTNRQRSRCQVGTFLYVRRAVTSNIIIAHCPWILQHKTPCQQDVKQMHKGTRLKTTVPRTQAGTIGESSHHANRITLRVLKHYSKH